LTPRNQPRTIHRENPNIEKIGDWSGDFPSQPKSERTVKHLTTSVVIPVYNAARYLLALLDALASQTHPPDEIILVDDGSTDHSVNLSQEWAHHHHEVQVTILCQPNQGPAAARNLGATTSHMDVVLFIDSDCYPRENWIEKMLAPFQDPQIVGVQGAYRCRQKEWIARFIQLEIEERYERMLRKPWIDFIGTYSAAYRREVFPENGGFDTRFTAASGEDADFSFRLACQGHRMVFQPEANVYHQHPDSLWRYLKVKYWRGYWRNLVYRRHPSKMMTDSYTPQALKFQTLLSAVFPLSLIGFFLPNPFPYLPLLMLVLILGFSLPFILWIVRKAPGMLWGVPFVLLLRAFALAAGAIHGALRGLWVKKEYQ
jgi:glycosyltransferase involved in cell wall biosynthesis